MMETGLRGCLYWAGLAAWIWCLGLVARADIVWQNTVPNYITHGDTGERLFASTNNAALGCFLQLVFAGDDDVINPANNNPNSTGTTGDDLVVAVSFFGYGTTGGSPPSPTIQGIKQVIQTFNTTGYVLGDQFYVRAWTAAAAAYNQDDPLLSYVPTISTVLYGNSALYSFQNKPAGDDFNFGSEGGQTGWSANLHPIPEPASLLLVLCGLPLLRRLARRRVAG